MLDMFTTMLETLVFRLISPIESSIVILERIPETDSVSAKELLSEGARRHMDIEGSRSIFELQSKNKMYIENIR